MLGRSALYSPVVNARLADDVVSKTGLTQFMRVTLEETADGPIAKLTGPQGSGMLSSIARADGLMVVPEDVDRLPAGSAVKVVRLLAIDDAQTRPGFHTRMTQ
jgi:molybdopterin molybdotransferase